MGKMKATLLVLVFLVIVQEIRTSPTRLVDRIGYEKYLSKAKSVLDRVPLIDGYDIIANPFKFILQFMFVLKGTTTLHLIFVLLKIIKLGI